MEGGPMWFALLFIVLCNSQTLAGVGMRIL